MSSGSAAAAAAHAARLNAIRSFGVIVTVEPDEFLKILDRHDKPLVVTSEGGFFTTSYFYLVSYKGLTFYTKSPISLALPDGAEIVQAKTISIPG